MKGFFMENREPKPSEDKSFTMDDQGTPGEARRKSWVLGMPEGVASLAGETMEKGE